MSSNFSKHKPLSRRITDYYKFEVKYWPKELVCKIRGHRDLRVVLHSDICEQPWHHKNDPIFDKEEAWCMYCDSGWLTKNEKGKWK